LSFLGFLLALADVAGLVVPELGAGVADESADDFPPDTLRKVAGLSIAKGCGVGLGDVPELGQVLVVPMLQVATVHLELNDGLGHGHALPVSAVIRRQRCRASCRAPATGSLYWKLPACSAVLLMSSIVRPAISSITAKTCANASRLRHWYASGACIANWASRANASIRSRPFCE